MRFLHITDTHIGPNRDYANYGHSALPGLEILVDQINRLTFDVDFILHSGDVVEDGSEAAYRNAKPLLDRLKWPVRYVVGNHDSADTLRRVLLGHTPTGQKWDYQFECGGVQFVVLDTSGPIQPGGALDEAQIRALREVCTPDGPPLVIAMHHPPTALDTLWIDKGSHQPYMHSMLLENGPAFMQAIAPARGRLCGVFFGHVHRAFQVFHAGVLLCSAASGFAQISSWPDDPRANPSPHEPAGFNLVTITPQQTTIRQYALPRA